MLEQPQPERNALSDAADFRALEEQLGSPDEATAINSAAFAASLINIRTPDQFRQFLTNFQAKTLATDELPTILRAYNHARQNQVREIIALDRSLKDSFPNEALANASERVGRNQLRRMRALKTERVVTRYWDAVHKKEAHGWHTVVFGVVLAVYSIPLRQGLNHYGQQTIRGFLEAGAASLRLRAAEVNELESTLLDGLPQLVEGALASENGNQFRCV
ncbi:MAG TPA: urease accessory UreF family protein [Verrucomicrobiae bacterium]